MSNVRQIKNYKQLQNQLQQYILSFTIESNSSL